MSYKRCRKCGELVNDTKNCANCAAKRMHPLRGHMPYCHDGKRAALTLDMQEGNVEEYF